MGNIGESFVVWERGMQKSFVKENFIGPLILCRGRVKLLLLENFVNFLGCLVLGSHRQLFLSGKRFKTNYFSSPTFYLQLFIFSQLFFGKLEEELGETSETN